MRTQKEKIEFLYSIVARANEIAVVAERRGSGDVGQLVLDLADAVAKGVGLPADYRKKASEWRLVNEGLEQALEENPE